MPSKPTYIITPQKPLSSGFNKHSTAKDILKGIDLSNKVCIVTGGYSGIGLETTRALAEAGATVVVPARSMDKARSALKDIPRVELAELDLINPVSIDTFAQHFLDTERQIDILINNAGIMVPPLTRDSRGYESQFATNHLGHFQLTARLWPALIQAGEARVISVSSSGIVLGGVEFDDPNYEHHSYDKWKAYGQSKSANALFAVSLDRLGFSHGIRAFSVHPGAIYTDLSRFLSKEELGGLDFGSDLKTEAQGAATSVWCATNSLLNGMGGVYCLDADIAQAVFTPEEMPGVLPWAIDPEAAERLWKLSEQMTNVKFGE
ncbi:oxidoreductase [Paenibacillus sp. MER 99-2]|uniref:oxidoreductase n=1 Tax=Paenibacillus sp. MER 99-2 TaxID=2939572 RepID=UPI002040AE1E|nr:oxidoreductase [Paenibacillus sp. MER 99-2]MCM3172341.1 oxidoreductase [Paenibacillus sp. MER 99-2]